MIGSENETVGRERNTGAIDTTKGSWQGQEAAEAGFQKG